MAWGKCKLCFKTGLLIGKSHIIPNFMYKGLFDEDNKIVLANLKDPNKKDKFQHTGYFDKHILCYKCEKDRLGKLDDYAASVIYEPPRRSKINKEITKNEEGLLSLKISNLDFLKFKKFILSILWRSHVSKQPFFKNVDIGRHEESLRTLLLEELNEKDFNYNIMILGILDKNGIPIKLISDPVAKQTPSGQIAIFFINGFLYQVNLGGNSQDAKIKSFYLKTTGDITIPILSGSLGREMFKTLGFPEYVLNYFTPGR